MLKKLLWLSMMMVAAAGPSGLTAAQSPAPVLTPGQIWSIKSARPTTAKVVINRVEPWEHQVVVHVSIIDVPIPQDMPGAGRTIVIGHMPFQQSALAASVDRLLATGASPASDYESGYKAWQDAKGGVFTITVEQAIKVVFQGKADHALLTGILWSANTESMGTSPRRGLSPAGSIRPRHAQPFRLAARDTACAAARLIPTLSSILWSAMPRSEVFNSIIQTCGSTSCSPSMGRTSMCSCPT